MILYIATTNSGKLRDFAKAANNRVAIDPLPRLKEIPVPSEDEPTFEGNARLKAIYYSHHAPGKIILADDSGLEVAALDGAPGVRSARYADDKGYEGPPNASPDERNNLCLLDALSKAKDKNREANYHCVLVAACDGKILATGSGEVEGQILAGPRGTQGFGYDPIFYLPEQNKTMAELDIKTKLAFSHRGRAFSVLLGHLFP
jgi:XTP/dITP diphosphohydrolase